MRKSDYNKLREVYAHYNISTDKLAKNLTTYSYKSLAIPVTTTPDIDFLASLCIKSIRKEMEFKEAEDSTIKRRSDAYHDAIKRIGAQQKALFNLHSSILAQNKKISNICVRELKRGLSKTSKTNPQLKAKRVYKELSNVLKKTERTTKDYRRKAERAAQEQKRKEMESREEMRQKRKFNYLVNQTELFAHFILNKNKNLSTNEDNNRAIVAAQKQFENIKEFEVLANECKRGDGNMCYRDEHLVDEEVDATEVVEGTSTSGDVYTTSCFAGTDVSSTNVGVSTSSIGITSEGLSKVVYIQQPKILKCKLKEYQLKGLNWLVNLYDQGINGILADDMGLGKTVQSISLLAYLAESENIWGPFLIVTPASTLHNWNQEFAKFLPSFKVCCYWGSTNERKEQRKCFKSSNVIVTSYQIAVMDEKIIRKTRWQYMILDEAQAIKSCSSQRWKTLLSFKCRNRLLLTGTPVQNSMQELWALLHFIMPTLFDSLTEFSEWFSKDIENSAEMRKAVDKMQLQKLHKILKPFMLRRHKNDVKDELSSKVQVDIICELSYRQSVMYEEIENCNLELENLLMQLKKVCNHPMLFEKREPRTGVFIERRVEIPDLILETANFYGVGSLLNLERIDRMKLIEVSGESSSPDSFGSFLFSSHQLVLPTGVQSCDCVGLNKPRRLHSLHVSDFYASNSLDFAHQNKQLETLEELRVAIENNVYRRTPVFVQEVDEYGNVVRSTSAKCIDTNGESEKVKKVKLGVHKTKDGSFSCVNVQNMRRRLITPLEDLSLSCYYSPCITSIDSIVPLTVNLEDRMLLPTLLHRLIYVPPLDTFISDSGKLQVLDQLLPKLKAEGHRILMYFQMTKMIDLMEDYLISKEYTYLRLDGSSRINSRRDTVKDWQTNDKFIFLLSTRAGGLGINLTAADTVIFYDSDWNPTVDQQAMDRAHRLGQTKDVMVYRLITKGTVEEKVIESAERKGEIQKMVIQGNVFEGKHF